MVVAIPFRAGGKSRLPPDLRGELALAMLGDVVEVAVAVGQVRVVTDDPAGRAVATELGAGAIADPGEGQGHAVVAALVGAAGPCLVVNADLPCVTPGALHDLAGAGAAFVPARDGTTNALALPDAGRFEPLYGPGSAARFAAAGLVPLPIPELEHDVDTLADLEALDALTLPTGRRTTLVVEHHKRSLAEAS